MSLRARAFLAQRRLQQRQLLALRGNLRRGGVSGGGCGGAQGPERALPLSCRFCSFITSFSCTCRSPMAHAHAPGGPQARRLCLPRGSVPALFARRPAPPAPPRSRPPRSMAGSTVANKAGGYWLGTFVFACIELFFVLFIRRQGGPKSETGCVHAARPRARCGRRAACARVAARAAPQAGAVAHAAARKP